ncbi:hypothetical protein ACIQU5_27670 [Streptomyces sp. NPDC090306]|uniref:hypothetical protein n=1 Tax=Streptomyces sp. NPDC090306 TaxID=3365961 RepID=UPI00380B159C
MAVDQLPGRMREFANYLQGLLGRLDQGAGWCGVFWQRDPEGMRACLEGHEVPPWDVVEALLQDLGAAYGSGAEAPAPERERARVLHLAALAAHDSRPGGRDALGDRLDIMLGEQRYAAERLADLGRRTGGTTTREAVEALRLELAWARDDHERATARCAELRARMAAYDRRIPAGPAPDGRTRGDRTGQAGPARLSAAEVTDRRADEARAAARGAGAPGVPRQRDVAGAPGATGPEARHEAWEDPARPRYGQAPGGPGPDRAPFRQGPGLRGEAPYDATPVAHAFDAPDDRADAPAAPPEPHPAPAPPAVPAATGRQRSKRRRGSARFAGIAEPGTVPEAVPPEAAPSVPAVTGGRSPRGARFAGAAETTRQQPEEPGGGQPDGESRLAVAATIESLVRLRREGRSGEAHAVLVEAAHWPAARFPLLAAELQRADLGADWVTLLWEAAGLPAEELVAAADALTAAGRTGDGQQILRQGVARPAAEIGLAVLGLADQDRHREVAALLDAYVRVRTPEEAARSAEPDPERLVPLLLEAARGVSDERHWDLVHALRVAGLTA